MRAEKSGSLANQPASQERLRFLPQIIHQPVENLAVDLEVSQAIARDPQRQLISGIDRADEAGDVLLVFRIFRVQIHYCTHFGIILIERTLIPQIGP